MLIELPDPSLVLLVGPSGTGKTSFASRHFKATEILSSDAFRAMVADDEGSREADSDAFQALRFVAAKRLRRGRLTVIDATNVRPRSRRPFIALAAARGLAVAALVFDLPEAVLKSRNRNHRLIPVEVLEEQAASMRDSMNNLAGEGIAPVYRLESEAAVEEAVVRRLPVAFPAGARAATPRPSNLARQLELLEP